MPTPTLFLPGSRNADILADTPRDIPPPPDPSDSSLSLDEYRAQMRAHLDAKARARDPGFNIHPTIAECFGDRPVRFPAPGVTYVVRIDDKDRVRADRQARIDATWGIDDPSVQTRNRR